MLIILPLLVPFFGYMCFLVGRDFASNDIKNDKGVIQNVFHNQYVVHSWRYGDSHHDCIDIQIKGKPYYVRLSSEDEKKYWETIADTNNINKSIEFLYYSHELQDTLLYNPSQLTISNKIIYPYSKTKMFMGLALLLLIAITLLFGYWLFSAIRTYRQVLLPIDREIGKKSIWKLIGTWLWE